MTSSILPECSERHLCAAPHPNLMEVVFNRFLTVSSSWHCCFAAFRYYSFRFALWKLSHQGLVNPVPLRSFYEKIPTRDAFRNYRPVEIPTRPAFHPETAVDVVL